MPWDGADEVTFECEPGTLQKHKLETLRELGVTRLSLGVENFDPKILEFNGRAHLEEEIHRAYGWARELGLRPDQHRPHRRHGRRDVGQLEAVRRARRSPSGPDSVTIYQMELPYNTVFSHELKVIGQDEPPACRHRRLADQAGLGRLRLRRDGEGRLPGIERLHGGEETERRKFVYRDSLWQGADMFGTGVASFGHVQRRPRPERRPLGGLCRRRSTAASCRSAGRCRCSRGSY